MEISKRVQGMGEPALLKYYPLVNAAKEKGKKVYYLNIGQPDIKTPQKFMEKLGDFSGEVLAYAAPEGECDLREAARDYYRRYGFSYEPEDILITNGGSEALLFTFLTICNPGDEIVTPEPLYSIYKEMASAASVVLSGVRTYTEEGFALPDRETIEANINAHTRAILITNPGNPTGKVFTREEIELLRDIALERGLYIIADEVYREFIYDDLPFVSPGQYPELDENCIIIDSISKRYSACGARIGFILSKNTTFIGQIKKLCQMRLAVSSADQSGAAELLKLGPDFFDAVLAEYKRRRDCVYERLKTIPGVVFKKPTGAFYYMVKLPVANAPDFIEWMITDFDDDGETVLLSPANDFYLDPQDGIDEVRLAYVLNEKDMKRALEVLAKGLAVYNREKN